ncbi:MAG: hypothetical protein NT007_15485 [Candidatus Kapabacteria bacterium]|nr:hypothetical protein [Candidatus Kapabacteria bacterium]
MLTIEYNTISEMLDMHFDNEGAKRFIEDLQLLIKQNRFEQMHLLSEEWGGEDLSSVKLSLSDDVILVNQLRLTYWMDKN